MRILSIDANPVFSVGYRVPGKVKFRHKFLPFYVAYVDKMPSGLSCIAVTSDLQGLSLGDDRLISHDVIDYLYYLTDLKVIPRISLMITAGDLFSSTDFSKLGATGDVSQVMIDFNRSFDDYCAVLGNHDKFACHDDITVLDGGSVMYGDLCIGGVSGIIGNEDKNQRKSKENYFEHLEQVIDSDIIVLHSSPVGNSDRQIGDRDIANYLMNNGSSLVLSGHCNWGDESLSAIGANQILNVDSKVIILVESNSI